MGVEGGEPRSGRLQWVELSNFQGEIAHKEALLHSNGHKICIEVMHKAWHYASTYVKVGHFEWLTMYIGVTVQKHTKSVSLKQATMP